MAPSGSVPTTKPDSPATASSGLRVESGQLSDPGRDPAKQINEDSCGFAHTKFGHLFVICDGMGGHAGGKEASTIAIRTIFETMAGLPADTLPRTALRLAIEEAARRVFEFGGAAQHVQRPGSTCVSIMLHEGGLESAHVGDSRAYAVRQGELYRLTRDHSMVQNLVDTGVLSEDEAVGHPDANKITRALGMTPEVEVEVRPEPMELYEGDVLLLCSDGLTDMVRNAEILATTLATLQSGDCQAACQRLVALANEYGGHDNVTVQVVRVLDPGPRPRVTATLAEAPGHLAPPQPTTVETPAFRVRSTVTDEDTHDGPTILQRVPAVPGGNAPPAPAAPAPAAVLGDPRLAALATAPNGAPAPTMVDLTPTLSETAAAKVHQGQPVYIGRLPTATERPARNLLRLVLAMAAVIGVLLALLIWALFYR